MVGVGEVVGAREGGKFWPKRISEGKYSRDGWTLTDHAFQPQTCHNKVELYPTQARCPSDFSFNHPVIIDVYGDGLKWRRHRGWSEMSRTISGGVVNGGFLSLAQIHRLLRPLRTKISKLAKALDDAQARPTTLPVCLAGPLDALPHPSRLQSRTFITINPVWDASSQIHNIALPDLSKMVYAVSDALRNVIGRSYGDELLQRSIGSVRPLMEMCAAIIGDDIEASVMELLGDSEGSSSYSGDDSEDESEDSDDDETYVVDGCYEQIPEHLRR